jgi:hypothetical protein
MSLQRTGEKQDWKGGVCCFLNAFYFWEIYISLSLMFIHCINKSIYSPLSTSPLAELWWYEKSSKIHNIHNMNRVVNGRWFLLQNFLKYSVLHILESFEAQLVDLNPLKFCAHFMLHALWHYKCLHYAYTYTVFASLPFLLSTSSGCFREQFWVTDFCSGKERVF